MQIWSCLKKERKKKERTERERHVGNSTQLKHNNLNWLRERNNKTKKEETFPHFFSGQSIMNSLKCEQKSFFKNIAHFLWCTL